jgi:hypothetical protein
MNRMIKLFSSKANLEYEKYLLNRQKIKGVEINSGEWQTIVARGFDLKARYETWTRAAELLRKEELNK